MKPRPLPIFRARDWAAGIEVLLLATFFLLTYGPPLALCLDALASVPADPAAALAVASPTPRRLDLLARTLALSAAAGVTTMALAVLAGSLAWQWRAGAGRYIFLSALFLVPLPLTVHALGWSALSSAATFLPLVPAGPHPLLPWVLSWWVETAASLPLGICIATVAFELVDPEQVHAGRVLSPDATVFARIVLPLASPLLLAGTGLVCLSCLVDYTVPSLYSANVYPFEIFAEFSASYKPANAFLLSIPLLVAAIALALLTQRLLRPVVQDSRWRGRAWEPDLALPRWFSAAQRAALGIFLLEAGLLAVGLPALAAGSPGLFGNLSLARGDAVTSVAIAAGAAVLTVPVAAALAPRLARRGPLDRLWWVLAVVPLAVPAPLVGIGTILFWNALGPLPLYGTLAVPVFAVSARFLPVAALVLAAQWATLDPLLLDAAAVFGKDRIRNFLSVTLPLLAPGILVAAAFVFAFGLGELGATLLVVPPGHSTLTVRLYNYLHYGSSGSAAALGLLVAGIFAAVALAGYALVHRKLFLPARGGDLP